MKRLSESSKFLFNSYLLRSNKIIENIILKKYKTPLNYYYSQKGGAVNSVELVYNGETFKFEENEENYWTLYDRDNRECVVIGIDPSGHEAHINNINADTTKCGNTILTDQGSHLFKITLRFLKEHRTKFNINKITLKDNAEKLCPSSGEMIHLAEFLTLLTGHTWYGKYRFRPIDSYVRREYRQNRDIMDSARLKDIDFSVILRKLNKLKAEHFIRQDQYDYFMEVYTRLQDSNPLVKDLLQEIFNTTSYDFICSVFSKLKHDFFSLLGLSIHTNVSYILPL